MSIRNIFVILLSGLFTENLVCSHLIGTGNSGFSIRSFRKSLLYASYVSVSGIISTALCYPILNYILVPLKADFLSTLILVLVSYAIVFGSRKITEPFFENDDRVRAAVTFGTVLGITCISTVSAGYLASVIYALSYGLGFILLLAVFFCAKLSVRYSAIPKFLDGKPLDLIITAIIALCFYALS